MENEQVYVITDHGKICLEYGIFYESEHVELMIRVLYNKYRKEQHAYWCTLVDVNSIDKIKMIREIISITSTIPVESNAGDMCLALKMIERVVNMKQEEK